MAARNTSGYEILWFASELGGDGLDLCILLQPVFAQFTSDSRLFITTKRRSNVDDVIAIHPDRSSSNTVRNRKRLFDVASPYSCRESVFRAVCAGDRLIHIFGSDDTHDGPEDLLPC